MIQFALQQRAEILPFIRETMDGELFDVAQTRPCRLEPALHIQTVYKGFSGEVEEMNARAVLYCEGDPIPVRSRVIIEGQTYAVLTCAVYHGYPGSYLEVTLA